MSVNSFVLFKYYLYQLERQYSWPQHEADILQLALSVQFLPVDLWELSVHLVTKV